jgi:hypothetical protein
MPSWQRFPQHNVAPVADAPAAMSHVPTRMGHSGEPLARRGFANASIGWTSRRLVTVAVLSPVLFAILAGAARGWAPGAGPGWNAIVALVALAAATTLATYLPQPGAGRRLDLGCTPCAAVAALSVVGAAAVLSAAPHDLSQAVLALAVVGFGLSQRLTSPRTCATPRIMRSKDF